MFEFPENPCHYYPRRKKLNFIAILVLFVKCQTDQLIFFRNLFKQKPNRKIKKSRFWADKHAKHRFSFISRLRFSMIAFVVFFFSFNYPRMWRIFICYRLMERHMKKEYSKFSSKMNFFISFCFGSFSSFAMIFI